MPRATSRNAINPLPNLFRVEVMYRFKNPTRRGAIVGMTVEADCWEDAIDKAEAIVLTPYPSRIPLQTFAQKNTRSRDERAAKQTQRGCSVAWTFGDLGKIDATLVASAGIPLTH